MLNIVSLKHCSYTFNTSKEFSGRIHVAFFLTHPVYLQIDVTQRKLSIFFLTLRHKLNDFFWQLTDFFFTLRHKEEIRPSSKTTKNSDLSAYEIEIILENKIVLAISG